MSDFLKRVEEALRTVAPLPSAVGRGIRRAIGEKKAASDREEEKEKYLAEYGESFKERTRADALEFQKMQKEGKIPLDVKFNPQGIATMRDYEDLWSDSYKRTRELGRRNSAALHNKLKQLGHPDFDGTNKRKRQREEARKDPLDPLVQEERLRDAEMAKRLRDAAAERQRLSSEEGAEEAPDLYFDPYGEEPRTPEEPQRLSSPAIENVEPLEDYFDPYGEEPRTPEEPQKQEKKKKKKATPLPKGKGAIDPSLLPNKRALLKKTKRDNDRKKRRGKK